MTTRITFNKTNIESIETPLTRSLDWLLKYINPETDEERDARIIEVSKNLRKMVQLPFNKLNKYE